MGMNRELAQLAGLPVVRRRNRWHGHGLSVCLARLEIGAAPRKQPVDWDKVLGLVAVLVVVTLSWIGVGIAVSHFLR